MVSAMLRKMKHWNIGLTRLVNKANTYAFDDERQDLCPHWNGA
jgi:hypothetical protein